MKIMMKMLFLLFATPAAATACNAQCQRAAGQAVVAGIRLAGTLANHAANAINKREMKSRPTLVCTDNCIALSDKNTALEETVEALSASDGVCDDGGPGSEFSFCFPGTDCSDCGGMIVNMIDECFKECPAAYDYGIDFGNRCEDFCGKRVSLTTLHRWSAGYGNEDVDPPPSLMKSYVWAAPVAAGFVVAVAVAMRKSIKFPALM